MEVGWRGKAFNVHYIRMSACSMRLKERHRHSCTPLEALQVCIQFRESCDFPSLKRKEAAVVIGVLALLIANQCQYSIPGPN